MKKRLLVLGMIACLFGLTACGNKESAQVLTDPEDPYTKELMSSVPRLRRTGTGNGGR